MKAQLLRWTENYCNERVHGTTKEKPRVLFEKEEQSALGKVAPCAFYMGNRYTRKVHKDCHIIVEHNFYSVPFTSVGEVVEVDVTDQTIRVFDKGKQIALHGKLKGKGCFSTQISHYPKYKYYTPSSPLYLSTYKEKMGSLGQSTEDLFAKVVQKHPQDWYRIIKGILNLRKTYSDEVIQLSCQRALAFDITQYSQIKRICESGCYHLPLHHDVPQKEAS